MLVLIQGCSHIHTQQWILEPNSTSVFISLVSDLHLMGTTPMITQKSKLAAINCDSLALRVTVPLFNTYFFLVKNSSIGINYAQKDREATKHIVCLRPRMGRGFPVQGVL